MGVAKGVFKFLIDLKKTTDKVHGKVLQLGRQCAYVTTDQMTQIADSFDVEVNHSFTPSLSFDPNLKKQGFVDDITFFKTLGFDEVESLDFSEYEDCSFVHDLNQPIPEKYYEQYDVIFDGGTLEHVFHFPNCLENIHKMLKPNGIIIHSSPSHNHVDHGFYMFSPTVYFDYYSANKYKILKSNIFEYHKEHDKKPWIVYNYHPGSINYLSYGGWGNKLLGIWFVAEKTSKSSGNIIPQQSFYTGIWTTQPPPISAGIVKNRWNSVKQFIRKHPILYACARASKRLVKFKSFTKNRPPVVARY